jgi:hypothetical protein
MGDVTLDDKPSLLLQIPDDLTVCLLDIDSLVLWNFRCESTSLINGTRGDLVLGDDLMSETDSVIIFSPCWSLVDDTGTGLFGDIVVRQDSEGSILVLIVSFSIKSTKNRAYLLSEVVEHRDISPSDHILSLETSDLFKLGFLLWVWLLSTSVLLVNGTE